VLADQLTELEDYQVYLEVAQYYALLMVVNQVMVTELVELLVLALGLLVVKVAMKTLADLLVVAVAQVDIVQLVVLVELLQL
jgi:hypothetical protein